MSDADIMDDIEIPANLAAELDSCRRLVAAARKNPGPALQRGAACIFRTVTKDTPDLFRAAVDEIYSIANAAGMMDDDATQKIINDAITDAWTLPGANDPPLPEPPARIITPADLQNFFDAWGEAIAAAPDIAAKWAECIASVRGKMLAMEIGRNIAEKHLASLAAAHDLPAALLDDPPPMNGHDAGPTPSQDDYGTITTRLPATIDDTTAIVPATFITPAAWPNEAPPPINWLVPGFIQRGDVTTLHGDGGAGKTDIALRLAANVARGAQEWLGREIAAGAAGPVLFISAEDPERKVRRRLWQHAQHDGYDITAIANLHLWFPAKMSGTTLAIPDRHTGTMRPTKTMQEIAAAIVALAPILVITDNVAATYGGNQNDRAQVRSFVNLWADIAEGPSRPAVLLLDHPSLSGLTNNTGRGGNMDWRNAVRSALHLYAPPDRAEADRGIRILETTKINEGKPGNPLRLLWADGGLQLEHAPTSLHRLAKEQQCEQIFLRLLDERNAQGGHVGRKTSGMYAPKVFAAAPDNGGFAKSVFAAAMDRLFAAGAIREIWDSKRRHDYIDRANAAE